MGATLKRRDGSGRVGCGFEAFSRSILGYAFMYHFPGACWIGQWCDVPPPFTLVPPEIMATIRARKKADSTVSYTVQIRLKKKGVLVYQESQTFARQQAAQAGAKDGWRGRSAFSRPAPRRREPVIRNGLGYPCGVTPL